LSRIARKTAVVSSTTDFGEMGVVAAGAVVTGADGGVATSVVAGGAVVVPESSSAMKTDEECASRF